MRYSTPQNGLVARRKRAHAPLWSMRLAQLNCLGQSELEVNVGSIAQSNAEHLSVEDPDSVSFSSPEPRSGTDMECRQAGETR